MKDFFSSLLNLNTIGYDYERVRKEIHSQPYSPATTIGIYFLASLVIVSFLVIGWEYCKADGDMSRVFKEDDTYSNSARYPSMASSFNRQATYGNQAAMRA